jgi:pre-peptidase
VCPGDVDGDAAITPADVVAAPAVLFQDAEVDAATLVRADANDDGLVTASDVAAILLLQGAPCMDPPPLHTPSATPSPTPDAAAATATTTATPTHSPTSTATLMAGTPTRTPTPLPTPTATSACIVQSAQLGTTNGQISASDCQRNFDGSVRYTDVYSLVGVPGTSIKIDVTTSGGSALMPFVRLIDADGQFDAVEGAPPIQFVVTTGQPYQLFVTTRPSSPTVFGPYTLTLSGLSCPGPTAISLNSTRTATLGSTSCPDPAGPTVGSTINPADRYTFNVSQVPKTISVAMSQVLPADNIDPTLTLIGPDGFAVGSDDDSGGGIAGLDAQMTFLAVQAGTYTIIAAGGGAVGSYSLTLKAPTCAATPLKDIPADRPVTCSNQTGPGCSGALFSTLAGGPPPTTCNAAPLGIPGATTTTPDTNSPADLYTFTGTAGDVISVGMSSDDDAHLYLLAPASAGGAVLAEDDTSGIFTTAGGAQLAATLPVAGTYTIVATNNNVLQPGDPPVNYTLYVQKCPARGLLNPSTGRTTTGAFNAFDCFGFGNIPFRTYVFDGMAGQFVTTTVSSKDIDAFVRVFAPDGSRIENDDDPFEAATSDARANRILPVDGRYIVEVSASVGQGAVDIATTPPPAYSVRAQVCSTATVSSGSVSGAFQDSDCELSSGQKFDVYTFAAGARPRAATILPPNNGCALGLFAEGPQTPADACSTDLLEMPLLSNGKYGFVIAAATDTTRGPYVAQVSSCPMTVLGFGDKRTGTLTSSDCTDATGAPADWLWFQAAGDLVQFNSGVSGTVSASFPLAGVFTDAVGSEAVSGDFTDDPDAMVPLGNNLGALLKITSAAPTANGNYTVSVDPASLR